MKRTLEVKVLVDVEVDSPLDLRMAVAHLKKNPPHIDTTAAGHAAGFGKEGYAKSGHSYSFSAKTRKKASIRVCR